ncbi:MAG: MFS transporter [Aquabacterium sp.]
MTPTLPTLETPAIAPFERSFTRLAQANLAAQAAEQVALAAAPIAAVQLLGAGIAETGVMAALQTLPFLLLALPAGLWVDRHRRVPLMVAAEGLRGVALLVLLAAALAGQLSVPLMALCGLVGAIGTVVFSVAAPTLVPDLVARERLARANGRLELARSIAFAGGPAIAGAAVAWLSPAAAFGLSAALSLWAAWRLHGIQEPPRPARPARHPWTEVREGAAAVWHHQLLRPLLLTSVVWGLSWFVLQAAYVPFAMGHLGLSAEVVGLTLAAYGIGMVVGALLAPRVVAALPYGRAVLCGPLGSVLAALLLLATLAWPGAALAAAGYFMFGAGPIIWTITTTTLRQAVTPPALLGRVGAVFLTVNTGVRPLGALAGSAVGLMLGPDAAGPACMAVMALGFGLQAWVVIRSPIPSLARLPAQPPAVAPTRDSADNTGP